MSDDLTRRIGDMLLDVLMADIPNLRTGTFANLQRAIASLIAEERASARREALEEAAKEIDCGCSYGPAVVKVCREYGHNCAARWQLCSFETCAAIEAAAIRSLAAKEAPKRAEVALPPEHQRIMRRALAASVKPMPKEADNDQ